MGLAYGLAFPLGYSGDIAIGPSGTLVAYTVEAGATLTFEWPAVVRKMWSGIETRASLVRTPRQRFQFASKLDDAQFREVQTALAREAVDAPVFLLALAHEDFVIASSTTSAIVLHDITYVDWAAPGQRILVVGSDGTSIATNITGAPTGNSIPVATDVSAIAIDGARVMPLVAVKLEADQRFSRHRVNMGGWDLVAMAIQNGYGATTEWGVGATVTEHDDIAVWDRGNVTGEAASQIMSGTSAIDQGLAIDAIATYDAPDWGRSLRFESSDLPEWQWFKAFLMTVRGRSTAFLLPTGRPDLVAESDASTGTLTVSGADYANVWATSLAHRRIKIVLATGAVHYRNVTASSDNLDGTYDLTVAPLAGVIARIEFLETVRLASDAVTVRFQAGSFESQLEAQVIQQ